LDVLIDALSSLAPRNFELTVIGSGPLEKLLRAKAEHALSGRIRWMGRLPSSQVPSEMAEADCLVLPSRHDGWGAVVSEALILGTPAICSDACGAAEVVRLSGAGGVFPVGDAQALHDLLSRTLAAGKVADDNRTRLADWAYGLTAVAGASYLSKIMAFNREGGDRPTAPWLVAS
jgi:glycosyltransferase involved in cell wall biosynthesis